MISLQSKIDIIKRKEMGERTSAIARSLDMSSSTIATILKSKETVERIARSSTTPLSDLCLARERDSIMSEMEAILSDWITDQNLYGGELSFGEIQRKALSIWQDLKEQKEAMQDDINNDCDKKPQNQTFIASRGWFNRFRKRFNLIPEHEAVVEYSTSFIVDRYCEELKKVFSERGYDPRQVFSFDEIILRWKNLPEGTLACWTKRLTPVLKNARDPLTLVLGGNASGDFKLKPCVVYHTENPCALKGYSKMSLPVYYRSTDDARLSGSVCYDYLKGCVGPSVEQYLKENNLPNKALFLLRDSPGHPESLRDACPHIEVEFFPPVIAYALMPSDYGIADTFRALYFGNLVNRIIDKGEKNQKLSPYNIWKKYTIRDALENIHLAWRKVQKGTMNIAWCKTWPESLTELNDIPDLGAIKTDIIIKANLAGVEGFDVTGVSEVLQDGAEVTPEDLKEFKKERVGCERLSDESMRSLSMDVLAKFLSKMDDVIHTCRESDIKRERGESVAQGIEESIACYRELYEKRLKAYGLSS